MKILHKLTIAAALTLTSLAASTQNLQQEITVEHDIVPVKREALKRDITPAISLPPIAASALKVVADGVGITLDPLAGVMAPIESQALAPDTLHHGYAALGYFPLYNLGASAGYSGSAGALSGGAWLQFNGRNYSRPNPLTDGDDSHYRRNTFTGGARAAVATKAGTLRADLTYMGDWYRTPAWTGLQSTELGLADQSASDFNLKIGFSAPAKRVRAGSVAWHVGADMGLFGYGKSGTWQGRRDDEPLLGCVKESVVKIMGGASVYTSDASLAGIDLEFDYQRDNRRSTALFDFKTGHYDLAGTDDAHSIRLLTLRPHWEFHTERFTALLGARIQFTGNSGKSFHIAPDVRVAFTPSTQFAIYAKAGGGEHLNTLASLHNDIAYAAPMMGYDASHLPLTLEAGLRVGPWRGAALRLYGRYATANDWLMPVVIDEGIVAFRPLDMRGALVGAELSYSAGRTASVKLSYECSPEQRLERGWYLWRDRARQQVEALGSVRPISPLNLSVGWRLRDRRRIFDHQTLMTLDQIYDFESTTKLGVISDLSLGADWTLNQTLNIWVHFENILSRSWQQVGFIPEQGFHGLAGVSCKF